MDEPDALHCWFRGQNAPQPCHVDLYLPASELSADYDVRIGGGYPASIRSGHLLRWPIPALTADAANRLLRELAPDAVLICGDWTQEWDGRNLVVRLGNAAMDALTRITDRLGGDAMWDYDQADRIDVWHVDDLAGDLGDTWGLGIGARTTDDELDALENELVADMSACAPSGVAVIHGLGAALRELRDQARDHEDDELVDQWAHRLDVETSRHASVGDLVSHAYSAGAVCGVTIDPEADDDHGSQLTSADGRWTVRWDAQARWWTSADR